MDKRFWSRAKRKYTGGWIYGYYTECLSCNRIDDVIISPQSGTTFKIDVDLKTVCQCTGETDMNKTDIYENDMVQDKAGNKYHIIWYYGSWCAVSIKGMFWYLPDLNNIEVIGNAIDNPELIT